MLKALLQIRYADVVESNSMADSLATVFESAGDMVALVAESALDEVAKYHRDPTAPYFAVDSFASMILVRHLDRVGKQFIHQVFGAVTKVILESASSTFEVIIRSRARTLLCNSNSLCTSLYPPPSLTHTHSHSLAPLLRSWIRSS